MAKVEKAKKYIYKSENLLQFDTEQTFTTWNTSYKVYLIGFYT